MSGWVWGSTRFYCKETISELLALSRDYVAAAAYRRVIVWRRDRGEPVVVTVPRGRPLGGGLEEAADRLVLRTDAGCFEVDLRSGEIRERGADEPSGPVVARDRTGTAATVTWPDGHVLSVSYPGELVAGIACAGEVAAVPHGLRAVDVYGRDGALRGSFRGFHRGVPSADGREIALVGSVSKRIVFGDVATGRVEVPELPSSEIAALKLSPDGARLLVLAGGHGWLLDPETGRVQAKLAGCTSPRLLGDSVIDEGAGFVAGGRFVVGGAGHQVVRWEAATGAIERRIAGDGRWRVHAMSCDQRGERVAVYGAIYPGGLMFVPDEQVRVWNFAENGGEVVVGLGEEGNVELELSPDGGELALVCGDSARIVALADGAAREVAGFVGFRREGLRGRWGEEGLVVERLAGGGVVARHPRPGGLAFAAGPEGQTFAVGYADGRVAVCDADGGSLGSLEMEGEVRALALGPGRVFAGGWDCTVHARDWR